MKSFALVAFFCLCAPQIEAATVPAKALKVIEMLSSLEAKVTASGKTADAEYTEFMTFCKDFGTKIGFELTTGAKEMEELKATIAKETGTISAASAEIEELAGTVSADESDLAAATKVRETEATEFAAEAKELKEIMETLSRAIAILERELSKTPSASMLQLPNVGSVTKALAALVQAS